MISSLFSLNPLKSFSITHLSAESEDSGNSHRSLKCDSEFSFTILLLLSFLFLPMIGKSLEAKDFRKENYSFYKDIRGLDSVPSSANPTWWSIELDEDIYRSSYYKDLRVAYGNQLVPYSRKPILNELGKSGQVQPKLIFEKTEDKKSVYVLEVPRIPSNKQLESIEILSPYNFEANARLYLGDEVDSWKRSRSLFIYQYNKEGMNDRKIIPLNENYYRYIRLEVDSEEKISFPSITYKPIRKQSELEFDVAVPKPSLNTDLRANVYYFKNERSIPFRRVDMDMEEDNFKRRYILYYLHNKEYSYVKEGYLLKNSSQNMDHTEISFPDTIADSWKLEIYFEDNQPITIEKARLFHPKEQLVISGDDLAGFLTDSNSNGDSSEEEKSLRLYYGFEYDMAPNFDLTGFHEDIKDTTKLKMDEEKTNPHQSLSIAYPPLSIWIIRFLFIIGVAGVGYLSFRVFRKWEEKNTPPSSQEGVS